MNSDEYEFYIVVSITVFCAAIIIAMHAINHIVNVNTRQLRNDIDALRLQSLLSMMSGTWQALAICGNSAFGH